jgi:hypothetical protein
MKGRVSFSVLTEVGASVPMMELTQPISIVGGSSERRASILTLEWRPVESVTKLGIRINTM